jgi:hypothetical protein
MTWQCLLIDSPQLTDHGNIELDAREVGDMWFAPVARDKLKGMHLTAHYYAVNANRMPLMVLLPGRHFFLIDGQCFNQARGYYDSWIVSGVPPLITVQPSINLEGRYHGYLTAGVIGDPL